MEWVEVQGKTVDLAVDVAMGELGLKNKDDAQIEIIQEPSTSFLGQPSFPTTAGSVSWSTMERGTARWSRVAPAWRSLIGSPHPK